jgi:hypothetical protein
MADENLKKRRGSLTPDIAHIMGSKYAVRDGVCRLHSVCLRHVTGPSAKSPQEPIKIARIVDIQILIDRPGLRISPKAEIPLTRDPRVQFYALSLQQHLAGVEGHSRNETSHPSAREVPGGEAFEFVVLLAELFRHSARYYHAGGSGVIT